MNLFCTKIMQLRFYKTGIHALKAMGILNGTICTYVTNENENKFNPSGDLPLAFFKNAKAQWSKGNSITFQMALTLNTRCIY